MWCVPIKGSSKKKKTLQWYYQYWYLPLVTNQYYTITEFFLWNYPSDRTRLFFISTQVDTSRIPSFFFQYIF